MPFRDSIRGDKEQLEVQHWPRLFEASVKTDDPLRPSLALYGIWAPERLLLDVGLLHRRPAWRYIPDLRTG